MAIRGPRTILALLTALNLLNYLDRMVLSAVLHDLRDDLHLSKLLAGWAATVFLIGYFATSPIFGSMADRSGQGGRKVLITVGIVVWSLATVATGLVHTPLQLFLARAFVGVGEASYATIAPTLIDEFAPPARKGRWLAVFYTAMPVGSALGYIVGGGVLAATHDWRTAFFVAGGPGILLALLCLLIGEPPREAVRERPKILDTAGKLFAIPAYRQVVLGYTAYTFALGGFAYWAPFYLTAQYGLPEGRASMVFGGVVVVSGIVGTLLGGWIGDRRLKGETDDATATRVSLWVCALSAGLGAPLALAAILAPSATGFFLLCLPCQVALFLSTGPVNVAILRCVPGSLRASAMALSIFAIHLGGDLWSPPLIGVVADHAPMAWAMLAAPAVFALGAFLWWRGTKTAAVAT
jgi:MFS family permease